MAETDRQVVVWFLLIGIVWVLGCVGAVALLAVALVHRAG